MVIFAQRSADKPEARTALADNLVNSLLPTAISAACVPITAAVIWPELPAWLVSIWVSLSVMSHGARIALWHTYRRAPNPPAPEDRFRLLTVCALAVGLVWGTLATGIAADIDGGAQGYIFVLAAMLVAGAAVATSAHAPAVDATVWPISVPVALASLWLGDTPHLAIGALLLLLATGARRFASGLRQSSERAWFARREQDRLSDELLANRDRIGALQAELAAAAQRIEAASGELLRANADAAAASRAKSEFLANMSHELRTPLNAIIGFAEVIERETFGPAAPRYREYASDIHGSGQHLLQVINDILDLAKVEAGQMRLHEARLDPALVMQGCVRLIKPRAAKQNVRLYTAFDPNLPVLLADEARLRQIGLNLLSNAVKFTKPGGRVTVSTGVSPENGITLAVSDTGIGMTAEEISIALEPFQQVTSSLSRTNEGTGLGLPLTKTLVEMHGGRLDIASVPGRGTTVTVTFPPSRSLAQASELVAQAG
jgi:signal transduction histidine kinase